MNNWYWALILIVVFYFFLWNKPDDTDKGIFNRSGMSLYTDNKTKLQYLSAGWFGQLTPRLDENGKQLKEESIDLRK